MTERMDIPPADLPRVLIAAPASGSGKTTFVCGLLEALRRRGMAPAAFKCGPDYIDPMFHRRIVGAATGNIDLFFTDEARARSLLRRGAEGCDVAVIEGVMGYYDGMGTTDEASSYRVARATGTPTVLLVNARGASLSLAATVAGFSRLRDDANIRGVVLNRCSESLCDRLGPAIERETGVPVLGCVPADDRFAVESRHLGLLCAEEIDDVRARIGAIADAIEAHVDLDALLAIARTAAPIAEVPYRANRIVSGTAPVTIAVARDAAFNFYYEENLRELADLGAVVAPFSPIEDDALPEGASALYIGGGYPELHAAALEANEPMRRAVARAVADGMPTIAECGGFMYLQRELVDADGEAHRMVGALEGRCENAGRLVHFGYVAATPQADTSLVRAGEPLRAHEFHYWHSTHEGADAAVEKPSGAGAWRAIVSRGALFAGYPHVFFPATPDLAKRFVEAARAFAIAQADDAAAMPAPAPRKDRMRA